MIRALSCTFSAVALATALFADDAEEVKTLRDELAVLRSAEQAIQEAASSDDDVKTMTKLIRDESLAKVYDKWSKKKWDEAVKRFEKDISTANREYRVPKVPTTAAEEMILILEPNLSLLKKKYESMDKGASGRADLKKQIEAQEKKIDELKKEAQEERLELAKKIKRATSDRRAEFEKIAKRIKNEIESGSVVPLEAELRPVEERIAIKKRERDDTEMNAKRNRIKMNDEPIQRRDTAIKECRRKVEYDAGLQICGIRIGALVSSLPRAQLELNKIRRNYTFGEQSYELMPITDSTGRISYGMARSNGLQVHYTPDENQLDFLKRTSEGGGYGHKHGACLISVFYNNFDRRIRGWYWGGVPSSIDWACTTVKNLCEYFTAVKGLSVIKVDQSRSGFNEVTIDANDGTEISVNVRILSPGTAVVSVSAGNQKISEDDIASKNIRPVDLLPLAKVVPYPRIPTNPCSKCRGVGTLKRDCPCSNCVGKCSDCKGTGWMECASCKVKGKLYVYKKNCSNCHGKHKVKCESHGYCEKCHCSGTVLKKFPCPRCSGSGEEP